MSIPAIALALLLAALLLCLGLLLSQQRHLRAQQQRLLGLETALEASGAAPWEWFVAERRIVLSDAYYRQLGYAVGDFPPEDFAWRQLLHPDDKSRAIDNVKRYLKAPETAYFNEYRMRTTDGRWRWILARGRVVKRDAEGQVLLLVGTHLDIDAMKRQQMAYVESQERFQKIYETTPDSMGITRISDGLYLDVNASFSRIGGYSREEVLGRTSLQLGVWVDPQQREQLIETFRSEGKVDSMEMAIRRKDGVVVHGLMSIRPLSVNGEDCMLFIYRDISEWRRLHAEAERARAEGVAAAAASRAKSEFLSRMSHELRTPLNAVLGFGQVLQSNASLDQRARQQLDGILGAGWHLLQLINDVLDLSRIEGGHLHVAVQPTELAPLLREALDMVGAQAAAAGISLAVEGLPALRVKADALRLRQALLNLLSNAIKYNRRGGHVWLRVNQPSERELDVLVADDGLGMSPTQLQHLFEPFNRLGREREAIDGTGIGLVLSRHLIEAMGGSLTLSSAAEQGTEARIRLKRA
ncbi:PAS domain-containing sensor histidine kinase [Paucibacter sp. APW11]|uniref:histidine kinase n=1 Tax=Roseateles aquae TaxID=3077235 RepID=A0ABU3PC92_9BURK|nr:PAS domain-containing sensor histidine kinase [Paucibacter sp. APW11]MDT9000188.1 PAS domain-containing sensor histidine kinase [Paucibacter sp. APW11]